ncbi:hypothetical protein IQ235_12935 [Oscillatoriales cyanobacterium LEGE 11467]|uniref:Uncharacterized protein n=1 Tax=Zarconia navalis LEGE 11467 TaxID=1828826 RepID=A0A928W0G6_9CYAN|nr:hypothetical protein [Zarconia navalis]MBE9041686.1 hypothetical protein [Zarconia navalis LEGE 11467]
MGKKSRNKTANLLYQRLQEALQQGSQVWIEASDLSYTGIPINLTPEFVEILVLNSDREEEEIDLAYERTIWLVRLSAIFAISYPTEYWSKERLERLLNGEIVSESPE